MSIDQIAKLAGVSVSTVSNFLNHPHKVAPETGEAIREALKTSGWQPDIRRRGPKSAGRVGVKTGNISLVMITTFPATEMWKMHTIAEFLSAVECELNRRHLSLTPVNVTRECIFPYADLSRHCDGVILFGTPDSDEAVLRLEKALGSLPAVWCSQKPAATKRPIDSVYYDGEKIGAMAAEYLFYRGHRRAALFNGSTIHLAYAERAEAFLRRGGELGMEIDVYAQTLDEDEFPDAAGFSHLTEAYLAGPQAAGAFFCSDDVMLGVYEELRVRRGGEPELDMIGCNNNEELLRFFHRRPASIDINFTQVGSWTVLHLLSLVNRCQEATGETTRINPRLIPGEQVSPDA